MKVGDRPEAPGAVTSGIQPVQAEGARQRTLLSRVAVLAFIMAGIVILAVIPGLALTWVVALISLVVLVGIIGLYMDRQSAPAYRHDHLAFSVSVPADKDAAHASGDESVAFHERVLRSVKGHLNRNRISNTEATRSSGPMKRRHGSRVLRLDSWMAEMKVLPGNAPGKQLSATIIVGPLAPATDGIIRKMMEGLRAELERELGKK